MPYFMQRHCDKLFMNDACRDKNIVPENSSSSPVALFCFTIVYSVLCAPVANCNNINAQMTCFLAARLHSNKPSFNGGKRGLPVACTSAQCSWVGLQSQVSLRIAALCCRRQTSSEDHVGTVGTRCTREAGNGRCYMAAKTPKAFQVRRISWKGAASGRYGQLQWSGHTFPQNNPLQVCTSVITKRDESPA